MTESKVFSARCFLKHVDNPMPALHPRGVSVLPIASSHIFSLQDIQLESKKIAAALDGSWVPDLEKVQPGNWSFQDRAHPPSITILRRQLPRLYHPDAKKPFKIEIRNNSQKVLNHFEQSGLAFELTLQNFDGLTRHGFTGFAPLLQDVAPNEVATLAGEINFPMKRVPLIIAGEFKSHGISPISKNAEAAFKQIVLPGFSKH